MSYLLSNRTDFGSPALVSFVVEIDGAEVLVVFVVGWTAIDRASTVFCFFFSRAVGASEPASFLRFGAMLSSIE